ncbi:hypothetical protein [Reticulibacter mediterranei]|uniref:hypothetical protein n=1 Tax=Reticulibacter mediterranei TaxID=2778369 RepID=UPI001C687C39|nr:hypothetical protein [Reticulibacter mediterranei]
MSQREFPLLCLLILSGRYRNDRELPRITRETVYECGSCQDAYFATVEQTLPTR